MKILAVDTALAACSAAVFDSEQNRVLAVRFEPMAVGHAEAIAPMVRETMAAADLKFTLLDRLAATVGPGTFTGVRIGLSFARGLGLALDLPVIGISTLQALAANITSNSDKLPIAVAIDARRGNVYTQLFTSTLTPSNEPSICSLAEAVRGIPEGRHLVIGSAAQSLISSADQNQPSLLRSEAQDLPSAAAVAKLASLEKVSGFPPQPLYLREPDAKPETARLERTQIVDAAAHHAKSLAALHAHCFALGWNAKAIAELMAMPGAITLLAQSEQGEASGFIIARCAAGEAEILTLAVAPNHRRRHIAEKLVEKAAGRLAKKGARNLYIEVAVSNAPARLLYAKLGFMLTGRRQDYYTKPNGGCEDAVTMTRSLPIAHHHV
jgi:tRNA threonylcarbamoyl adenosine modification protein YeaZ/ribosomal-protein-alanine acetyltransferase